MKVILCVSLILSLFISGDSFAIRVTDDENNTIELKKLATRVITLAPSLTEMIFTIGAEDKLVATVKSSNYPAAANKIARIGDYERFNMETLLSYKPDLVLAWSSGNNRQQIEKIKKFNIPVYLIEPRKLEDIATTLRNIGILLGQSEQANQAADDFEYRLKRISEANKNKDKIKAFYQIWHDPIFTVNGEHVISRIMQMCGLVNVFQNARILAPKITEESVIGKNPEIIIASGMANGLKTEQPDWLSIWKKWPAISAVASGNLFFIHPDLINRQSTRILDGAEKMCEQADIARKNMKHQNIKKRDQTH